MKNEKKKKRKEKRNKKILGFTKCTLSLLTAFLAPNHIKHLSCDPWINHLKILYLSSAAADWKDLY